MAEEELQAALAQIEEEVESLRGLPPADIGAPEILTRDVYPELHRLADRLTAGCQAVLDEFELPGYAINVGPKGCVMFTPERVTNYRDFIGLDTELWSACFYFLANRGILLPPGPDDQWTLSVQHTDAEIDRHVDAFRDFAAELTG